MKSLAPSMPIFKDKDISCDQAKGILDYTKNEIDFN